jgi:hypothetical protein
MGQWTKFDAAIDSAKHEASRQTAQRNAIIDEISKCCHRKNVRFYRIECEHPDRQYGRQCAGFECPVLFKDKEV